MQGTPAASDVLARASMIRNAKRHEDLVLDPTDPRTPASKLMFEVIKLDVRMENILQLFTKGARGEAKEDDIAAVKGSMAGARSTARKLNIPVAALFDVGYGAMQSAAEGDDATGYRVRIRAPVSNSSANQTFYVVREDGQYKILATQATLEAVGNSVLKRIEAGDLAGARRLLDWIREDMQLGGGDDPLAGPVFPHFWTRGQEASAEQMRYAAAALLAGSKTGVALPLLLQGREQASSDEPRIWFDVALAAAYSKGDRDLDFAQVAERLLRAQPNSETAFAFRYGSLATLKHWAEAEQVVQARLARLPGDEHALRALAELASRQGQSERAMGYWRQLVDAGKATANDMNGLAWQALVAGNVTPEAIQTAQQANLLTQQNSFAILHTVAALYAEIGKTTEARGLLLKAMEAGAVEEPNEECWYVFGRIAEQYGEFEDAAAAYRKLNPPKKEADTPAVTYYLAKRRLDALAKEKKIKAQ